MCAHGASRLQDSIRDDYIFLLKVRLAVNELPDDEVTQISIPTSLYETLGRKIEGTSFHSVSDYVTHLLKDVVREVEKPQKETLSDDDERKVQDRLRALGYM